MRLQSVGARLSSTVGIAVVSSVITTMVLTGGYAVATTVLPDNSVSSINIVDGTIRGRDLSALLRDRIGTPGPQGPAGPQGPQGPPGPEGRLGLHEVRVTFPFPPYELGCERCDDWTFPWIPADALALTVNAADYPLGATARADFYWLPTAPEGCVRIYDLTADAPISESEMCSHRSADDPSWRSQRTPAFPLPIGDHRLVWQMKYGYYVFDVSLIIEWP